MSKFSCFKSVYACVALLTFLLSALVGCAHNSSRSAAQGSWLKSNRDTYVVVTVRNPSAIGMRAGAERDYEVAPIYGPSPRARIEALAIASQYGLQLVDAWPIHVLSVHCMVYAAAANANMEELISRLRQDERVESVQSLNAFSTLSSIGKSTASNAVVGASLSGASVYSDPYYQLQSNLQILQVPQAQRVSRGAGVRIAVIDTGIDSLHPDLSGRVSIQRDFVDAQTGTTAERHGTAVAGVIAALDNNRQGIVGIAPASQLIGLRACWQVSADSAEARCNTFTLAQALAAAIDLRANVVNLSLSGPTDPLLDRLVIAGMQKGIVYVGAMPHASTEPVFPSNIRGVIAVDSARLSNEQHPTSSSVYAPGRDILTLTPAGGYDFVSGSSLAAASVTGGVALMLAHQRRLPRDSIANALAHSTRIFDSVDFCKAMHVVDSAMACE